MAKAPSYIPEKLTWLEINRAVKAKKVPVVPVGAIEQHGLHMPLDVDCVCARRGPSRGRANTWQDAHSAHDRPWLHRTRHGLSRHD